MGRAAMAWDAIRSLTRRHPIATDLALVGAVLLLTIPDLVNDARHRAGVTVFTIALVVPLLWRQRATHARLPGAGRRRVRAVARRRQGDRRRRAADRAVHRRGPRVAPPRPVRGRGARARRGPRGPALERRRLVPAVRRPVGAHDGRRRPRDERAPSPGAARVARGSRGASRARARPAGAAGGRGRASTHRARDARHRRAQPDGHDRARGRRRVRGRARTGEGDDGDGDRVRDRPPGARRRCAGCSASCARERSRRSCFPSPGCRRSTSSSSRCARRASRSRSRSRATAGRCRPELS